MDSESFLDSSLDSGVLGFVCLGFWVFCVIKRRGCGGAEEFKEERGVAEPAYKDEETPGD